MASFLRPRRGKKATAESQNIVLKRGEVFFEVPTGGVGTGIGKIKMGDGTTAYSSLPYFLEQKSIDVASSAITFTESSSTDNATLLSEIKSGATVKVLFGSVKKLLSNINSSVTSLNNDLANIKNGISVVSKATSATYATSADYVKSIAWNYVTSKPTYYAASFATSATYSSTADYAKNVNKLSNGNYSMSISSDGYILPSNDEWLGSSVNHWGKAYIDNLQGTAEYANNVDWTNISNKPTYYSTTFATSSAYAINSTYSSKATSATSAVYSSTANYSKSTNKLANGDFSMNISTNGYITPSSNEWFGSATNHWTKAYIDDLQGTATYAVSAGKTNKLANGDFSMNISSDGYITPSNNEWLGSSAKHWNKAYIDNLQGTASYVSSLKDVLVVDYFKTTKSFVFNANYSDLCTAAIPTKSGYKLKDISFFLVSKKNLDLTKITTSSDGPDAYPSALVIPFYSNTTTMTTFYYSVYLREGSDSSASTAYIYFKCLWIKE